MACAKKCDRCGKYYDPFHGRIDKCECNAIHTSNVHDTGCSYTDAKIYELCPDCFDKFSEWIHMIDSRK